MTIVRMASRTSVRVLLLDVIGVAARVIGVAAVVAMSALLSPALDAQAVDTSFDEAYERLRLGPEHSASVPTGRIELTRTNRDGQLHLYVMIVPENYDASRPYPVAFYLHGGVGRPDPGPGGGWWRNYDNVVGHDRIAVLPASWNESLWWQASQVENLRSILSDLNRTYNVDENRVYLFGSTMKTGPK